MSAHAQRVPIIDGVWEYMTTVDHKRIGKLYLIVGGFFFLLGGMEALLMRWQLMVPNNDVLPAQLYNEMLTMHGTTMIFLAAMPILFGLMNAVVPLQIGARDVAFPFLNALGFWLFFFGGILLNSSWFLGGAPDAGWTSYAPLSLVSPGHGIDFYVMGLQISGIGTLLSGINFLVTIINMRAPGMTYMRLPLFTWATFGASVLILFAFPALTAGLLLLMFDRLFGGGVFSPDVGGNAHIWQHLFWIFGHPEVYILIFPAFGIFSDVISTFSRKRLFGYTAMVFAILLIGFFGFMVWAHHMFTVGLGPLVNAIFAVATMAIAVPTGIKIFNWLFTMWGGQLVFSSAMLWSVAFIPTFLIGGVTGVMLASAAADYQYHDTYFVVAHFHYVIVGGTVFGIFAGLHYWWPIMFGRVLHETMGKIVFWLFSIGFNLTFFIQHFLGLWGLPRRYFTYGADEGLAWGNMVSTIGAVFMTAATFLFIINIVYTALSERQRTTYDPWNGRTLEWSLPCPPPFYNFEQLPLVRSLDPWWQEKREGRYEMTYAEPLADIHMPNNSLLPLLMSFGLFVSAYGWIYHSTTGWGLYVGIVGLAFTLGCLLTRSLKDDLGYTLRKEQLEKRTKP
ncbi:cytochrome c oxidase subunit I [Aureibacillus halotolerans]|uniref:Cytochrome c oxidase subunit 1 n=1 Tax=Aureibacillus halotolerans TaxID=1508390 RepID=A0A4R6TSY4_9BACI|nr:cytochrome c oxidase subunit I [Aureibacillus halotolerans]TDQ36760.1 cytochrome c oxidase subunit 1 [Aureibacillus halotolerans]